MYRMVSLMTRRRSRRAVEWQDADDRTHDAFMHVLAKIQGDELHEPERLAGYVNTTVLHRYADVVRRDIVQQQRIATDPELLPRLKDHQPNPEEEQIALEQKLSLRGLLAGLPARQRHALIRVCLDGQPVAVVCLELGIQPKSFRPLKLRAIRRLRELAAHHSHRTAARSRAT